MRQVNACGTLSGTSFETWIVKTVGKPCTACRVFHYPCNMVKNKKKEQKLYHYSEGNNIMDIENLRLRQLPQKQVHQYLKGPIPLSWLCQAACIPGRSLHVAIALWHVSKLTRSKTVKMQGRILTAFGISRGVYQSSLDRLEELGLISIERNPGSRSSITILDNLPKC